jgi:hypothetical protein
MTARTPILLRWTEEAEAEQVRALAAFQREPESAAVRPIALAASPFGMWHHPALPPWLLSWFNGAKRAN